MLSNSIENLIQQLVDSGLAVSDEAIPAALCELLLQDLDRLHQDGAFSQASIGRGAGLQIDTRVRGDQTHWLEEKSISTIQKSFFEFMHLLQQQMNQNLFIGVNEVEAHYALYPPGTGYDKHIDQHAKTVHRKITFILYLNKGWQPSDGGELQIFDPAETTSLQTSIQPIFGRLVLFRSEVFPHQVATCGRDRKSLTGWFRS